MHKKCPDQAATCRAKGSNVYSPFKNPPKLNEKEN